MAKDDVTPQDIFRLTNGTASDRAVVAKYCIQDCNLVHHLFNKLDIMTGYIAMADICSVPISFLVLRGQGIKLTSFVAKKCRDKKTLMPDIEKKGIDDGYEGAIVLPPKCDMYMDNPVACVDYSSLYPSSMISQNYSHDSKVWTREYNLEGVLVRETGEKDHDGKYVYDNLPGYEYIDIEFDTFEWRKKPTSKTAVKTKVGHKVCRWVQLPNGQKSIMPTILEELLKARKETRNLIKTEKDAFMQNILDKRQLGYKVTANSLYGQCGSKTSTFYEQDVAASTTATGRMMITYAKRIIEDVYGDMIYATKLHGEVQCNAEYVYGDSVANYTPVYIRKGGTILDICKIEDLPAKYGNGKTWSNCLDPGKKTKEICEFTDLETWTEKGWTPLQRVIRHRLASHKKIIRILTNKGIVDVTDDHSLLLADGETEVSPNEVEVGTEILHYRLPTTTAEFFTEEDQRIVREIQTGLNSNSEIVIFQKNQINTAYICWIAESIGLTYCLSYDLKDDGISKYMITIYPKKPLTKNEQRSRYTVRKMEIIDYPEGGYVYDFTTSNHHFSAGIGNIVVHNTDSVFFTFNLKDPKNNNQPIIGKEALEITIEIAQDVANLCTQFLKPPMELSYEKTLWPFCLLSKKRYFGKLFEYNPDKGKLKFMGLSLKRRDNCDLLKDVYGQMLDILLIPELSLIQKIDKCMKYLDECLEELIEGRVSMDKLAITKSLSGYYKNPEQIAHAVLAERIGNREAGNKPKPGDRIKYVHIFSKNKTALQGERIETPEFIRQNGVKIDYTFYITNQLMKPLQQLFGLALKEILMLKSNPQTVDVFKRDIEVIKQQYGDDLELYAKRKEKYCSDRIKRIIFEKYLIQIKNQREGVSQINKYFDNTISKR
jgi:DNA polymerase elongation subunit (family B)